jgi:hypothetical protein
MATALYTRSVQEGSIAGCNEMDPVGSKNPNPSL